ncbi:MAG: restriction endonuclease [Acidobacteria bacterium]|nr:restriction endonuclease [Acidobacteriota bacterium]MBI3661507.1 restriction endonuclease [Acidobacteriota bacterium]
MRLALPSGGLDRYTSPSQRTRVATEAWAESNLFCPICPSPHLEPSGANTPAVDFTCPRCASLFQLKSKSGPFTTKIVDAAYAAMRAAILEDRTPNLFALHYQPGDWKVHNLFLVPRFAFPLTAIEKRNPLGPRARRAGWIGCNILLDRIPADARIPIVLDGAPQPPAAVRARYRQLTPFAKLAVEKRGWTLDVLNVVRSLGRDEFSLADVYAFERDLARLHPGNRHVRDKIRQQLQILRKMEILEFLGHGRYRLL